VRVDLAGRSLQEVIREVYRQGKDRVLRIADLYRAGRGSAPTAAVEARGGTTLGDVRIDRYVLHHDGALVLPLVHVHGPTAGSGRIVLRVGLDGKIRPENWPEVLADLKRGDGVVSFDPRGLGETRMRYKAVSIDDPELAAQDEAAAYVSPVSGVLANYAYNGLLTGRPYFFEMIEDAGIAARFSRERLGAKRLAVGEIGEARTLAAAIAAAQPGIDLAPALAGNHAFSWAETVEGMREVWPIHYLVPGGAYVHLEP
jgi:hypothetical protein